MSEEIRPIHEKLASFQKKYYLNLFIKGALLTASLTLAYFILAALVEYTLWLSKGGRLFIFTSFFLLVGFCIYRFLKLPLQWWIYKKGLDEQQSAKLIGTYFPSVSDRLLNLIQLANSNQSGELARAGIAQKSRSMEGISFESAIDLRENKKYLKYLAIPFLLLALLWIVNQNIFTQSAARIVQFNREFSPEAPFQFQWLSAGDKAFFNEDHTVTVQLSGSALPDAVYLVRDQQRLKMEMTKPGVFAYTFQRLQSGFTFQFQAAGFYSSPYTIDITNRPELTRLKVALDFPRYLGRKPEELLNAGNLEIPEGTKVTWQIGAASASKALISFSEQDINPMQPVDDDAFLFGKNFNNPTDYWIDLENDHAKNRDRIFYSIRVVKDQFPSIAVEHVRDSVLYKNVLLGGNISDDYGLTGLELRYTIDKGNNKGKEKRIPIEINKASNRQSFFFQWQLDSMQLKSGDKVHYYLVVTDNDGVNGRKSTQSAGYVFALPSEEEIKAEISKSQSATEGKIDQSINRAKNLRESIEQAQQKLRGKQNMDWQDQKMLEDLVKQKQSLDQMIRELQKENEMLEEKKDAFTEENERIREKSEQIKKLMDELLDEETKKLFEELEKLLKENTDVSQIQKMLEKMDRKEINLEKELERTLELFKQLQLDFKIDQAIQELKEQTERQEQLMEETKQLGNQENKDGKNNKEQTNDPAEENQGEEGNSKEEELAQQQEALTKEFEEFEKSLEDIEKLGEELDQPTELPTEEEKSEVKDAQQQSKEQLQQGKPQKAAQQQQKSVQQMKQMQKKLEGMQASMQMEIDTQNLESLRQIVHGLIKLSFDQENLMKEFNPIQQTDPRYVQLGQNQLKIQDDAKVLEDSLLSLSKRDPALSAAITREIGELNDHINKAVENVKERRKGNASTEMQFSMTSINNLALMLKDHFDMMMQMMANAMPKPGKGKGKGQMNLGQMQQQLNQKMEQLKNGGGKSGRELSEELAKMAAEQERIRRALQEMQEKLKQEGGKLPGGDLPGKMEQTEMDLVNKQITEQTIRRQREILTRLLEAEKSMREQDMDEERKGETAKEYEKEIPRAFEEYLRLKEKEVELLKTVPPKLYPYYKREVNEYFKRIGTEQ